VGACRGVASQPGCSSVRLGPREILSWEIGQKYFFDPTFGNALEVGQRTYSLRRLILRDGVS